MPELTVEYDGMIVFHGNVDAIESHEKRDSYTLAAEFEPRSLLGEGGPEGMLAAAAAAGITIAPSSGLATRGASERRLHAVSDHTEES